jgi:glycine/D-amino acid oxidase-like deaminating enzyme
MTNVSDFIVIGGGIVGASAAYRLARSGARVTLVDRDDPGQATAAGAGIIAPATSTRPLPAFYPLAYRAGAYYDELRAALAEDGETATGYDVPGLLHVATSETEAARLPDMLQLFQERAAAGAPNLGDVTLLDGGAARALFPPLGNISGAIHVSAAARVDGRLLRDALRRAAERRGATVIQGDAALVNEGGRIASVRVGERTLPAGAVLLASGAWSGAFAGVLGLPLPVYPQRGQIAHLELPGAETGRWPIIVGFHSHYLLTFPSHRVVAGATREEGSGFDYRLTAGGTREVLSEALRVAPGLADATVREWRVGLRPASSDGLPILGRAPHIANAYLATGHGPSGLQLGPYSGALVADLARGEPPPLDLTPFRPERFLEVG